MREDNDFWIFLKENEDLTKISKGGNNMEYVYTLLLLHKVGQELTVEAMENVLKAADIEPNRNKIWAMRAAFKGVDIDELLKTTSMPAVFTDLVEEIVGEVEEEEEDEGPVGLSALFG